jgi:arginase
VRDEDVIVLGVRDEEDVRDIAESGIAYQPGSDIDLDRARKVLVRDELDGFWIHVDADVVDPSVLPAVDSPTPGGLDAAQLTDLLRGLVALPGAAGLEVTILDPDLDEDGSQAALLADILVSALTQGIT